MLNKTKIIVAGIGGVGGYFGGLLAHKYIHDETNEIYFIARGKHLQYIKENGLKALTSSGEFTAKPFLATNNPGECGIADYIMISTKSYDLENIITQLKPCIGADTIILPLLNGVDSAERIRAAATGATVCDGCVYIVARLKEPGVVENAGNVQKLYFGSENAEKNQMERLEKLMLDAGIEASLSENIQKIIWEKYIFISPTATATSFFDCSIGRMMKEHRETVSELVKEAELVARLKSIPVDADVYAKTIHRLESLPYDATSSMHSDYKNNKPQTEIESLTGYMVRAGKEYGLQLPVYNELYNGLLKKTR